MQRARPPRAPSRADGASCARPDQDAAEVEDLDVAVRPRSSGVRDGPAPTDATGRRAPQDRWPAGAPGWVRGPGALLAAAVVAALVAGGLGAHAARARAEARARAQVALLTLQAGIPSSAATQVGAADGQGWSSFLLGVPLVNRGPDPVAVSVLGLTLRGQRTAAAPVPMTIRPGATATVPVPLQVRCSAYPLVSDLHAGVDAGAAVRVRTTSGQDSRVVRLPLPVVDRQQSVSARLTAACAAGGEATSADVTWTPLPGGTLRVDIDRTGRVGRATGPLLVFPRAPAGLGLRSTPPLPDTVPGGQHRSFVLSLAPDCAAVGDRTGARVDLVVVDAHGVPRDALPDPDSAAVAWVARQVALRCG